MTSVNLLIKTDEKKESKKVELKSALVKASENEAPILFSEND